MDSTGRGLRRLRVARMGAAGGMGTAVTKPRRWFPKGTPQPGELSRWIVQVGDHSPGVVVSQRVGETGALWLAYPDGDPERAITYDDPRQDDGGPQGKVRKFFSRREAADALLLAATQPDQLSTPEVELAKQITEGVEQGETGHLDWHTKLPDVLPLPPEAENRARHPSGRGQP